MEQVSSALLAAAFSQALVLAACIVLPARITARMDSMQAANSSAVSCLQQKGPTRIRCSNRWCRFATCHYLICQHHRPQTDSRISALTVVEVRLSSLR